MLDVTIWILVVELLGLIALPIVFVLVPWLPDRGYTIAKPAGILLTFYILWLLASSSLVTNNTTLLVSIIVALTVISINITIRQSAQIKTFIQKEWRGLLISEVVFIGILFLWIGIKSYDPAINHTEQPMDFAFFNSSLISQHFPPQDPWLAGESISYYYFGYLIFAGITRLAAIPTEVGYNLSLSLVAAMAAMGIFGITFNLIRLTGQRLRGATISALISVLLLLGIANMESALELFMASGLGSQEFWAWINIKGLNVPTQASTWYPSDSGWWWWRATRVIDSIQAGQSLDYTITEFPFFSLLLGDLHPHLMSIPFVLMFLSLILNFFVAPIKIGFNYLKSPPITLNLFFLAIVLGGLGFINLWDMPTFGGLFIVAALIKGYSQEKKVGAAVLKTIPTATLIIALALTLYTPFFINFDSQASGIMPVTEHVTHPVHFLIIWGLFLLIAIPYIIVEIIYQPRTHTMKWSALGLATILTLSPWILWSLLEFVIVWDLPTAIHMIWGRFLHLLPIILVTGATLYAMLLWAQKPNREPDDTVAVNDNGDFQMSDLPSGMHWQYTEGTLQIKNNSDDTHSMRDDTRTITLAHTFPLMVMAMAMFILMGPELFYIEDLFNNRMNTMFKLSYQAWILLAITCSYAIWQVNRIYHNTKPHIQFFSSAWIGLIIIGILVSFYYPVASAYTKTSEIAGEATLDGLNYMKTDSMAELLAIQYLKETYHAGEIIIEAVGDDYSEYGRVAASTGIPTVLGWTFHEQQWRGSREPFSGREEAVKNFYETDDIQEAKGIINMYGVTYILLGPRERTKYNVGDLGKFAAIGKLEFEEGDVQIYRANR